MPDEPGPREAPRAEFSPLGFLLGILGQGLGLGITQPLLTGNTGENPGKDLGRERWGAWVAEERMAWWM